jgi:Family of unknown function (DUF6000)
MLHWLHNLLTPKGNDRAFEERWVDPFCMKVPGYGQSAQSGFWDDVGSVYPGATSDVISKLLTLPDWRPRSVGGFFAGLSRSVGFQEQLEQELLSGEFFLAGKGYCFAMVCFGSDQSSSALCRYLDIWLPKRECFYNQMIALGSLLWLDSHRSETRAKKYLEVGGLWDRYIAGQPQVEHDRPLMYEKGLQSLMTVVGQRYWGPNQTRDADATE